MRAHPFPYVGKGPSGGRRNTRHISGRPNLRFVTSLDPPGGGLIRRMILGMPDSRRLSSADRAMAWVRFNGGSPPKLFGSPEGPLRRPYSLYISAPGSLCCWNFPAARQCPC